MASKAMHRSQPTDSELAATHTRPCWGPDCPNKVSGVPGDPTHCATCQRKLDAGWKHCFICTRWFTPGEHPEPLGVSCKHCKARFEAEEAEKREEAREARGELVRVVTWRGFAVATYEMADGSRRKQVEDRAIERIPKTKLVNLDKFVEGFTREEVKAHQRTIMRLHGLTSKPPKLVAA